MRHDKPGVIREQIFFQYKDRHYIFPQNCQNLELDKHVITLGDFVLTSTFCHIKGVGTGLEQRLWRADIQDWFDVLGNKDIPLRSHEAENLINGLKKSVERLYHGDSTWFALNLGISEHWRLLSHFWDNALFLHTIANVHSPVYAEIVAVAIYDHKNVTYYYPQDLSQLSERIKKSPLIITFNGYDFDLRVLKKFINLIPINAHVDIRHVLRPLAFSGNQMRVVNMLQAQHKIPPDERVCTIYKKQPNITGFPSFEERTKYMQENFEALEELAVWAYNYHLDSIPLKIKHNLAISSA